VHKLEIYYLANQDPHVYFALLTDFADSPQESLPGESELVQQMIHRIDELNSKYCSSEDTRFSCFIANVFGTNLKENGWAGNVKEESLPSSMPCYAVKRIPLSLIFMVRLIF
jgi:hypothetical protein